MMRFGRGFVKWRCRLKQRPYRTIPHAMGLRPGLSFDNVEELLDQAEGETRR